MNLQETETLSTIAKAAAGDVQAFEQLVLCYQGKVYGLCLRMLKHPQDAMDAAQETLIKIYRNLREFQNASAFSSWVYRIAMNTCLDALRRRKAKQAASLDEMEAQDGYQPPLTESPQEQIERTICRRTILQCIDALPDDQRAVIVLRDLYGQSYEEIARSLGLNLNTVKSRISRARSALRKKLCPNGELFCDISV